jgi:hypothetical protein
MGAQGEDEANYRGGLPPLPDHMHTHSPDELIPAKGSTAAASPPARGTPPARPLFAALFSAAEEMRLSESPTDAILTPPALPPLTGLSGRHRRKSAATTSAARSARPQLWSPAHPRTLQFAKRLLSGNVLQSWNGAARPG